MRGDPVTPDARHDLLPQQERQHVVAVHPLLRGRVDLDAVVEVEELLGALALPHDRVEGAVGRDLQFIRINGTLVGGLVGVTIHLVSGLF